LIVLQRRVPRPRLRDGDRRFWIHPTLTWQVAHSLARAEAAIGHTEAASAATRLARETIEAVAARAPASALRQSFLGWPRVTAALEDIAPYLRP
jgi:hypothetical protein